MSQARKFHELQLDGAQDLLPELKSVEVETRQPREDRDLLMPQPRMMISPVPETQLRSMA